MNNKHKCQGNLPHKGYGPAITYCIEAEDQTFWAGNDEYESMVWFCPFCGTKAPRAEQKSDDIQIDASTSHKLYV